MKALKTATIQNLSVFVAGMMAASMIYSYSLGVANIPTGFAGSGMLFGFYTSGFNWIPVQTIIAVVCATVYLISNKNNVRGQK